MCKTKPITPKKLYINRINCFFIKNALIYLCLKVINDIMKLYNKYIIIFALRGRMR